VSHQYSQGLWSALALVSNLGGRVSIISEMPQNLLFGQKFSPDPKPKPEDGEMHSKNGRILC
jgi:hypothetical protein